MDTRAKHKQQSKFKLIEGGQVLAARMAPNMERCLSTARSWVQVPSKVLSRFELLSDVIYITVRTNHYFLKNFAPPTQYFFVFL